ncbi:hypothetical protein K470DRAFT_91385 [Piedraia hortae CBS 480.64]|uniref:Zinc finger PHD-type domain-containing protein n=1 Tax=Piedraia hortae CBS 480.64 TaxID=1314780 RepID=A0A6A7BXM2_9PEZI|nr:hypothetical protein K470DRAFT_91385 [Piedraia hortae CBS 480.64]
MPRLKRKAQEMEAPQAPDLSAQDVGILRKLRNMWQFAAVNQAIYLFGHRMKIDEDFTIEAFEEECLKAEPSPKLAEIGLEFLKKFSSNRGLTMAIFSDQLRNQYRRRGPHLNPFGDRESPIDFNELDIFTRVKVLHQLSNWALAAPKALRTEDPKEERDSYNWRMTAVGYDANQAAYYVLDDYRLYRREDKPLPPKPKARAGATKAKAKGRGKGKGKGKGKGRAKAEEDADADAGAEQGIADESMLTEEAGYGFTEETFSCVAITLAEYDELIEKWAKSRNDNEKELRRQLATTVRPLIVEAMEERSARAAKKLRQQDMEAQKATAKRSSRLADKAEKARREKEMREAEMGLQEARQEQKRAAKATDARPMTRGTRAKQREQQKLLAESPDEFVVGESTSSFPPATEPPSLPQESSSRSWEFDCSPCGQRGKNIDDGTHSVACDKCGVWQHTACSGLSPGSIPSTFHCSKCVTKEFKEVKLDRPSHAVLEPAEASWIVQRSPAAAANGIARNDALRAHYEQHEQSHTSAATALGLPPARTTTSGFDQAAVAAQPAGEDGLFRRASSTVNHLTGNDRVDLVEDGMAGPWPAGSSSIPKKHDQAQGLAPKDGVILQPITALDPSPTHKTAERVIPQKRAFHDGNELEPMSSSPIPAPKIGGTPTAAYENGA